VKKNTNKNNKRDPFITTRLDSSFIFTVLDSVFTDRALWVAVSARFEEEI
jgi:hypothetical protein